MPIPFYDIREPFQDPDTTNVERVYCLDWARFTEAHWDVLGRLYPTLPGWQGEPPTDVVPHWFGKDENKNPHLWVSVEPPGLHMGGILPTTDWLHWLSRFEPAIADLPSYDPG